MDPIEFHVPLEAHGTLAIVARNSKLTGVVCPRPIDNDHVTERNVTAAARTDAAHREAADLGMPLEQRRSRYRCLLSAHPECLNHCDAQHLTLGREIAPGHIRPR